LNDWPDRFIHTNLDAPGNIAATKLKRAGFIGAASGYYLATAAGRNLTPLADQLFVGGIDRDRQSWRRGNTLSDEELQNATRRGLDYTSWVAHSTKALLGISDEDAGFLSECLTAYPWRKEEKSMTETRPEAASDGLLKFVRKTKPKGPMAVFGFDYFEVEWAKRGHTTKPKLLEYEGLWGGGEEYAYEVLNFADGKRNAQEIRDAVSAEYGPVPLELVVEYLKALEEIGILGKSQVKK
jgi:hypothetical protein